MLRKTERPAIDVTSVGRSIAFLGLGPFSQRGHQNPCRNRDIQRLNFALMLQPAKAIAVLLCHATQAVFFISKNQQT